MYAGEAAKPCHSFPFISQVEHSHLGFEYAMFAKTDKLEAFQFSHNRKLSHSKNTEPHTLPSMCIGQQFQISVELPVSLPLRI